MTPAAVPQHGYPWRLFFALLAASLLSVLALLPYLSVVIAPALAKHPLPLPLPVLALLQATMNFGIATGLGLLIARQLGLGAPVLEAWLYRRPIPSSRHLVLISCAVGVVCGFVIAGFVHSRFGAVLAAMPVGSEGAMAVWKRFLACFYGGIAEEIFMRLFLLSLVLWLLRLVFRPKSIAAGAVVFWVANVLVAIAFGAGHLPLAQQIARLTPELVTVIILLNAAVALPFGYLYWTRGFEAAMLAHFSADVVLHVISPAVM